MDILREISAGGWTVLGGAVITFLWAFYRDRKEVDHRVFQNYEGIPSSVLITRLEEQKLMWCKLPEVVSSGILGKITDKHRYLQEACFEFLATEVSYLKYLNILISVFKEGEELTDLLGLENKKVLFGNVEEVRQCSETFLKDLVKKWEETFYVLEMGELLEAYGKDKFRCYIKYCSNQPLQEKLYQQLQCNQDFERIVKQTEESVDCKRLTLDSYLMMPMQRVTRLPLLLSAVIKLCHNWEEKARCEEALRVLNDLVKECNEGARETQDAEETKLILQKLELPPSMQTASFGAFLLKSEFMYFPLDSNGSIQGRGSHLNWSFRKSKPKMHVLILHSNQLIILRKRSSGKLEIVTTIHTASRAVTVAKMAAPPVPAQAASKEFHYYFVLQCGNDHPLYVFGARTQDEVDRWKKKLDSLNEIAKSYDKELLRNSS